MEKEQLYTILREEGGHFLGTNLLETTASYGMETWVIHPEQILPFAQWMFDHPVLRIQFLTDITGIHYPEQKGKELGIIYHFHSLENNLRLRIKCFVPVTNPHITSLTSLYLGANWMERETFDFFGIIFKGHPDLRRILNVPEMDYFPLRKEYPLEDGTRIDKEDKYFGR